MNDADATGAVFSMLKRARALIEVPSAWIPSGYAADSFGRWRPVGSEDAVRFSLIGAIVRAGGKIKQLMDLAEDVLAPQSRSLYEILRARPSELTHAESLEILDVLLAGMAQQGRPPPKQSGFISAATPRTSEGSLASIDEVGRLRERAR